MRKRGCNVDCSRNRLYVRFCFVLGSTRSDPEIRERCGGESVLDCARLREDTAKVDIQRVDGRRRTGGQSAETELELRGERQNIYTQFHHLNPWKRILNVISSKQ